jgi:uncharacterized protein YkwD
VTCNAALSGPARRRRVRSLLIVLAAAASLVVAGPAGSAQAKIDHAAEIDPIEHALLSAINEFRADRGMGRLQPSIALQRAADRQSYYILDHDWFSHDSRDGLSFAVRVRRYVNAHRMGETLAWAAESDSQSQGRQIAMRWLHSSSHRAELLNARYTRIGIARRGGKLGNTHANVFTADFASG